MKFGTLVGAAALALTLLAGSAQADVLLGPFSGGPIGSPGSFTTGNFLAGAGPGTTTFRIDGYASIDGDNTCCTDVFTLNLNGVDIFSGSWNLGGIGGNAIYFGPVGSTANPVSNGFFAGGYVDIFVPLTLIAGNNVLNFSYSGADQGLGDESWGLSDVIVNGNAPGPGPIPEPATWAMMIIGFGAAGSMIRRRKAVIA